MIFSLNEINERAKRDPQGFIAECEENMRGRIKAAADKIIENMKVSPVVLLAGPSGAGKTTTAHMMEAELERRGIETHTISMDNYFKSMGEDSPRLPDGSVDFESPAMLDMELMNIHFHMLKQGEMIYIPYFSFKDQRRSTTKCTPMQIGKNEIVIYEGIHALNRTVAEHSEGALKLYIDATTPTTENGETVMNSERIRLVRRTVRDNNFRGADAEYTLVLWENVMAGEKKYIAPFSGSADLVLNSSLEYEMCVLKDDALPLYKSVPDGENRFERLKKLIPALEKFVPISSELVPKDSLLREFIGNGIYEH